MLSEEDYKVIDGIIRTHINNSSSDSLIGMNKIINEAVSKVQRVSLADAKLLCEAGYITTDELKEYMTIQAAVIQKTLFAERSKNMGEENKGLLI